MELMPRERWIAVIKRQRVDRVPCDIWATPEVFEKLAKELNCADQWAVIDKLEIDAPYRIDPTYIGPSLANDCDFWGVRHKEVNYGTGTYHEAAGHPLASAMTVRDIDNYNWPKAEWFDYSQLKVQVQQNSHRPLRTGWVEPFLFYSKLRGLEQAMIDMAAAPAMVECAFDHIFHFGCRRLERILNEIGSVDFIIPSEDLGSQHGPLFSLECFRRFHKPRFMKYIELAKQAGSYVFFHTDGACKEFIPDLIEIGVDILNPIQHRCPGMEREGLKKDFGKMLVFHGGVENQEILPFGTTQQVRQETLACFETLGVGGGYICASCHNIQPVTPVENILAMYDTIKEIGSDTKYTIPQIEN
jgi:uroporphyrinogen decarboxylase